MIFDHFVNPLSISDGGLNNRDCSQTTSYKMTSFRQTGVPNKLDISMYIVRLLHVKTYLESSFFVNKNMKYIKWNIRNIVHGDFAVSFFDLNVS